MEDLASFIQSLSEKYGLIEFASSKVDTTTTERILRKNASTTAEERHDVIDHGSGGGMVLETSWECLSAFVNKHDLEPTQMHGNRLKKSSASIRRGPKNGSHDHSHEDNGDIDDNEAFNQPESGSSDRTVSLANTMQTSDLIQNASFLDELQNPSLSEDLQSTGMTKGRDSLDPMEDNDHCSGQSSLLHEFLTGNEEKEMDVLEFAKEMGLSSFDEFPQKEDATWQASDAWFRDFCSSRNNTSSSSQRVAKSDTRVSEEVLAHDILLSNNILLSSGSSSSPAGTELDGQVEDCQSASASQCGAGVAAATSRCASPEGFAAALESVERGRERAAIVNARVEKMLEESNTGQNGRTAYHVAENGGTSMTKRNSDENFVSEDGARIHELHFGLSENGNFGAMKKRAMGTDDGGDTLLSQLHKSRFLLSPCKLSTSFRRRCSPSHQNEPWKLPVRAGVFREEVADRTEQDDDVTQRELREGGGMTPSRHQQGNNSSQQEHELPRRASSRGEREFRPESGVSPKPEDDFGHSARNNSSYYSDFERSCPVNQEADRPSSGDQLHEFNLSRDSGRDQHADHHLRIRLPEHQRPTDQYDPRNSRQEDSPRNQEELYRPRKLSTQDQQIEYSGSGIVSPRDKPSNSFGGGEFEEDPARLVQRSQNLKNDEGFCARSKEDQDLTRSWGREWTEVEEEEIIESANPLPTPRASTACHSKWERVNHSLCQNGFPVIRSSRIPSSDFEEECYLVLSDVVSNYERREKFVQALLEEGDDLRLAEERNNMHIQHLEGEKDEAKQKLEASERRAEFAAKAAERNYAALRRECQKLESSNANLTQRCRNSQLEHACRAKERTLQKLQDKVRESMVKEERHRNNDKEVYEQLKRKVASAQHTNGEVLEPNFLQRDLKPAQIVGIYERQKVVMETEIANLRAENAQLCREMCEKENIILNKVLGTEETKKAFELLSRQQHVKIDEKDKEISRLEEELKERPTMEEVEETIRSASCQHEPHEKLNGRAQDESYLDKILRQICQLLELEEPSFIVETLESLLLLVSAVPRMEQFVSDVCDVVFCEGRNWSFLRSDDEDEVTRTPEAVPRILKAWLQKLEESSELRTFKETIIGMLWERGDKNAEPEPEVSCRVVVGCVKNLIDVEKDYLSTKTTYRDADAIVTAEPQKLLHRLLAHFQMLFEIPKMEGVMAVMNSVYIKCTEYHNFARALSSMLGIDKEAGPNTIISAVNSILSRGM